MIVPTACLVIAALLCLPGCDGDPPACNLDSVLERYFEGGSATIDYVDCGSLPQPASGADEVAWRDAAACVQTNAAARTNFGVTFALNPIDSEVINAYAGFTSGATWEVSYFLYDSFDRPTTVRLECDELRAVTPCTSVDLFQRLCITCIGERVADRCEM